MRNYLLRINGHYYTRVDSPHGSDVVAVSAAHKYARGDRTFGHGAKILVEVMDPGDRKMGLLDAKVAEKFIIEVSLSVNGLGWVPDVPAPVFPTPPIGQPETGINEYVCEKWRRAKVFIEGQIKHHQRALDAGGLSFDEFHVRSVQREAYQSILDVAEHVPTKP